MNSCESFEAGISDAFRMKSISVAYKNPEVRSCRRGTWRFDRADEGHALRTLFVDGELVPRAAGPGYCWRTRAECRLLAVDLGFDRATQVAPRQPLDVRGPRSGRNPPEPTILSLRWLEQEKRAASKLSKDPGSPSARSSEECSELSPSSLNQASAQNRSGPSQSRPCRGIVEGHAVIVGVVALEKLL